jgi:hypothetical protein
MVISSYHSSLLYLNQVIHGEGGKERESIMCIKCFGKYCNSLALGESVNDAGNTSSRDTRSVRLAYQPPTSSTFLLE